MFAIVKFKAVIFVQSVGICVGYFVIIFTFVAPVLQEHCLSKFASSSTPITIH